MNAPTLVAIEERAFSFRGEAIIGLFTTGGGMVGLELDRWREARGDTHAEVTIRTAGVEGLPVHVHQSRLNLTSLVHRERLAKTLAKRHNWLDWAEIIEHTARQALAMRRQGEPAVRLADVPVGEVVYRWAGYVPEEGVTVVHADGGSGKSTLGLALAAAVSAGVPLLGIDTRQGRPIYLDFEAGERTQARRLRLLARGMEIDVPDVIHKHLDVPLPQCVPELLRLCDAEEIAFVVLDSLGLAGAVHRETEETLSVFRALHALRRPVFAIHHDNRAGEIFGSIYIHNSARSRIEIRKQQDAGDRTLRLALLHRKANDDVLRPPLGAEIRFLPEATLVKRTEIETVPELAEYLPLSARLLGVMRRGAEPLEVLAELTGEKPDTVGRTLRRLRERKQVCRLEDGRWGVPAP